MSGFMSPKVGELNEQRRAQKSLKALGFLPKSQPSEADIRERFRDLVFEAHPDSETFNANPEYSIDDMRRAKDWLISKRSQLGWSA